MTCASVNFFHPCLKFLLPKSYNILTLHGKSPSKKRPKVFDKFQNTKHGILMTTDLASRGLDFPINPVDWIIQFDPPQDPSTFVHRVGRTARNGADGNALVFLMPNEEAYIDYLAQKDISMKEMEVTLGLPSILPKIKYEIKKDRTFLETCEKSFISYLRAYREHHLNYIFAYKDLPLLDILN